MVKIVEKHKLFIFFRVILPETGDLAIRFSFESSPRESLIENFEFVFYSSKIC